jgi:hypothetical protein
MTRLGRGAPVDLGRLRREFPALTDEDVAAYVEVSRRILEAGPDRARVTRGAVAGGRAALDKAARGESLTPEESLLARYLAAVEKMQRKGGPTP